MTFFYIIRYRGIDEIIGIAGNFSDVGDFSTNARNDIVYEFFYKVVFPSFVTRIATLTLVPPPGS